MSASFTTASEEPEKPRLAIAPLLLGLAAIAIQMFGTCYTVMPRVVAFGLVISVTAIVAGHFSLLRIHRGLLRGRGLALGGLLLSYFSLVKVPDVYLGAIALAGGICGGGLLSK